MIKLCCEKNAIDSTIGPSVYRLFTALCKRIEINGEILPFTGISLGLGARYVIAIFIGVPALLCFIAVLSCICSRFKFGTHGWAWSREAIADFDPLLAHSSIIVSGLDGPTIESYPKIVLDESRRLPEPDEETCPICLSEYRPKETVKRIPECRHCFHAQCIDEWLPLNATCPICRTSPQMLPKQLDPSWIIY